MARKDLAEQIAQQPQPLKRRASATQEQRTATTTAASPLWTGRHPGMHPEDDLATTSALPRRAPNRGEAGYDLGDDWEYEDPRHQRNNALTLRQPYANVAPVVRTEEEPPRRGCLGWHPVVYLVLSLLCIMAFITAYVYIPPAWQHHLDDMQFSYPRTYQMDANVGHGDRQHPLSHFIALNLHGAIEVIEVPGDPEKHQPYLYIIVHLAMDGADLVPATLSFQDMNDDHKPDMLVFVNGTFWVWFNDGTKFVPHL